MAKMVSALLYLVLVLATFAQSGLGQHGSTHVFNDASNDITHWKYLTHTNGTIQVIYHTVLAKGTGEVFEVPEDVTCISTSYAQYLPTGDKGQSILDWCTTRMPVPCLPDCYWIIDDTGFSVANAERNPLTLVAVWEDTTSN